MFHKFACHSCTWGCAKFLCIIPILAYVLLKWAHDIILSLGNKKEHCVHYGWGSGLWSQNGKWVQFLPRSSLETLSPYLEVKELAVAPVNGLGGAAGPRDPNDVDLQGGTEEAGVNTKGAFPSLGHGKPITRFMARKNRLWISALPLTSCMTLARLLAPSGPQLPLQ